VLVVRCVHVVVEEVTRQFGRVECIPDNAALSFGLQGGWPGLSWMVVGRETHWRWIR
jgi:hypothetical protein